MNTDLMSRQRHAELVKAAEAVVEGMNSGMHPDAALLKAAQECDLNSKEVALVSHAVNNSATVSHLANSEGKDKGAPFTLTNADVVSQQLFPQQEETETHNDSEPGKKPTDKETTSPNSLDPQVQKKKLKAAAESYQDDGFYLDDPTDHVKVAREAFGLGRSGTLQGRQIINIGLNKFAQEADFGVEADQLRAALDRSDRVDCSRLTSNPYFQLRNLKVAVEHARGEYTAARDKAFQTLAKLAEEFRRTDAPQFARIEVLAKHAGCSEDTLDVIFTMAGLGPIGQKRAGAMKIASHVRAPCSPREHVLVNDCLHVEKMWKRAADCLAAQNEADAWHKKASALVDGLMAKQSADDFLGEHVRDTSTNVSKIPGMAIGEEGIGSDFIGKVTGDYKEDEKVRHPLDLAARQRVGNITGATKFNALFDDDFIAGRPIPEVVKAYNAVISAKPGIDQSTATALVREQLARGGGMDSDALIRLKKDYRSQDENQDRKGGEK